MATSPFSLVLLAPGASDLAAFESVRARVPESAGPEPVQPQAECLLLAREGEPLARCSLQVVSDLCGAPGRSGLIGHYEALQAEAGMELLAQARQRLAALGVERVLGPVNGSTWARYRLALPPLPEDPPAVPFFLSEPRNPPDYPDHFTGAGFWIAARYESRVDEHLDQERPGADAVAERVAGRGITVRHLDLARFDRELADLFQLSLAAFADNLYYSPIDFEAFRAMYDRLRPLLDPELVLLAHDGAGRLIGVLFVYPDPATGSGNRPTRAVVKTVASAPQARGLGLGNHLLDRMSSILHHKGYGSAIHALMHVSNFSMKMSARHRSRVIRRYALYEWTP